MKNDYLSVKAHGVEYKQLTERSSNIFALREQSIKPIINILYNNKINARVLIGQSAMVYCAGKPMVEEFVNHSPLDLQILLVFYQHPAWFISL